MSSAAHTAPRGPLTRAIQLVSLGLCFGVLFGAKHLVPHGEETLGIIAGIGLFIIGGTLASEVLEPLRVPHLTGYLGVGILAGPHVLHLVDHQAVESMTKINALALALIALEGGAELKLDLVRKAIKTLMVSTLVQTTIVLFGVAAVFAIAKPLIPFVHSFTLGALFGVSMLWGLLGITRSPSAALGILSQTRAQGPLATFTLAFIMTSDVVVIVSAAVITTFVKPLLVPGAELSSAAFQDLWHEILGSVSLGTTIGLLIVAYLRFVKKNFIVVLVALGFGFTEVLKYLGLEPLLTFLVAGFLVQNLSKQGEELLHAVQDMGSVVYVLFFATAGAHLNIPLLKQYWVVALVLFGARAGWTWIANAISTRVAKDPPVLRRWGFAGLVSQAGVAIGLAGTIAKAFPSFGASFQSLAIATVALNEMLGPILFKTALDVTGESSHEKEKERSSFTSMRPPPVA
jgi:Kef-type K+ transport system membrane component KefB